MATIARPVFNSTVTMSFKYMTKVFSLNFAIIKVTEKSDTTDYQVINDCNNVIYFEIHIKKNPSRS